MSEDFSKLLDETFESIEAFRKWQTDPRLAKGTKVVSEWMLEELSDKIKEHFRSGVSKNDFEKYLSLCNILFERQDGAEYNSINYMIMPISELRKVPENMSAAGVRNMSTFLENIYNGGWRNSLRGLLQDGLADKVKNLELHSQARKIVNDALNASQLETLEPKYHDLETFKKVKSSEAKLRVLEHWTDPKVASQKYYGMLKEQGKMPETQTALADIYLSKLKGNDYYDSVSYHAPLIRPTFIIKDIMAGKADMLDPKDIFNVLKQDKTSIIAPKLIEHLSDKTIEKLSESGTWNTNFNGNTALRLYTRALKIEGKPASYYEDFLTGAEPMRASSPKVLEEFLNVATQVDADYKNSPEYQNAVQKQGDINTLKDELNRTYNALSNEQKGLSVMTDIQNTVQRFYNNVKSACLNYPDKTLEALCSRAIDGDQNAKIAVPELKLPLLFGREKAKEEHDKTVSFINAFNEKLAQIAQDKTLREVLNSYKEQMLSENTLLKQKEKTEEMRQKENDLRAQLGRQERFLFSEVDIPLNRAEKFSKYSAKSKESVKAKIKSLNDKKERLQAAQDMSKRDNPPVSSQEKKNVSQARYQARQKIVRER